MTSIFILQAKTDMMERKRQNVIAEHKYGIIWIQSTAVFYNSLTEMYVYQGNGHIPFYVSSVSWGSYKSTESLRIDKFQREKPELHNNTKKYFG